MNEDALGALLRTRGHEMSDELKERVRSTSVTLDSLAVAGVFGLVAIALVIGFFIAPYLIPWVAIVLYIGVAFPGGVIAFRTMNAAKRRIARRYAEQIGKRIDEHLLESAGASGSPVAVSLRESKR